MRISQNDRNKHKIKSLYNTTVNLNSAARNLQSCWIKQLDLLESSLLTMRDELIDNLDREEVSVMGQILMENAADRAINLTKEIGDFHKTLHLSLSKVGKSIEKNFDQPLSPAFKTNCDLTFPERRRIIGFGLIYDYTMCTGLNNVGMAIKKVWELDDIFDVQDPDTLQSIVIDLRNGDIGSSLEYLERTRPPNEKILRRSLQTQMITDCIEMGFDSYERTLRQLKKFKSPFTDDRDRASRLVGALLIGKESKHDSRYRNLFDYTNREVIAQKMTSFFVPYDAPLKNLLKFGFRNINKIAELSYLGYSGCWQGSEMPIGTYVNVNHSAFACPILKEQCTSSNPPMRLVCGHVVSRDAITRLTTSQRSNRGSSRNSRHLRFKCPYCPRDQYIDHAAIVVFERWLKINYSLEDSDLLQFLD